ncbi:MAG TPA: hypothetical protein PKH80_02025 [Methanofastidiosum sp.]|nr:hypothetical protein [Methanofastidiosum sp.]HNU60915.1 hypothetical protein [Methanofastidiosum sp.]
MKKEIKLLGPLLVLLVLSSIFSGCVSQGTTTISYESTPTGNEQTPSTTTPDATSQSGSPYILASISYDTETIDNNNHIQLSIQNYGKSKATNVAIVISNDYYSNFSLVSVNPNLRVEGNRFYIGDIGAGEKLQVDIRLKAKQSGVYTGTISYTYDGLEESGKIMDLTTRVP